MQRVKSLLFVGGLMLADILLWVAIVATIQILGNYILDFRAVPM